MGDFVLVNLTDETGPTIKLNPSAVADFSPNPYKKNPIIKVFVTMKDGRKFCIREDLSTIEDLIEEQRIKNIKELASKVAEEVTRHQKLSDERGEGRISAYSRW